MRSVILVTAQGRHQCAYGREVLDMLNAEGLVSWREVDANADEGRVLTAAAPRLRPVLFDTDGRIIAYGRLSARRLRRQVAAVTTA